MYKNAHAESTIHFTIEVKEIVRSVVLIIEEIKVDQIYSFRESEFHFK